MDINMSNIDNLKTDDRIADILKKLKEAESKVADKLGDDDQTDTELITNNEVEPNDMEDILDNKSSNEDNSQINNNILPWFNQSDKDNELMHYIKFDDSWNIVHETIPANKPISDIASLKLKKDYVCDIDYYKSKHYVLFVKQLESNYKNNRVYSNESKDYSIEVTDTQFIDDNSTELTNESFENINPSLEKISTDDLTSVVTKDNKYSQFIVFTDIGVADFVTALNDVSYPYTEPNFSRWFEETSNYVNIKDAHYISNMSNNLSNSAKNIKDHKYDIITMHSPGLITLDSTDDESSILHIKLKEEYEFIPLNRILGCLKYYASHNTKSIDEFRTFIDTYFEILT